MYVWRYGMDLNKFYQVTCDVIIKRTENVNQVKCACKQKRNSISSTVLIQLL